MHAGFFDMLHDAGYHNLSTVRNGIHVHFHRVLEVFVDQDWMIRGGLHGRAHVAQELRFPIDNLHGAATEDIGRSHHHGVRDLRGHADGFFHRSGHATRRLLETQPREQVPEALSILGQIDGIGTRS